jgi:hypothetical protein
VVKAASQAASPCTVDKVNGHIWRGQHFADFSERRLALS